MRVSEVMSEPSLIGRMSAAEKAAYAAASERYLAAQSDL